ncbi:parallel beta helix pectate lyase-like protein [Prosthecobacter fusiformis]|uniref:Parallel beta helix pectate lyase-like protein n=1 Tax=Prosthecobacter fusiformis TaxID=48464 RepID=A0A4R7SRH5_9BACT|nr:right-handed parallel beta-helix repeat-containing protein [Prosthecobacter fusiformis]TDU81721.1 parallel beta helix pectate lyase-like protein [Prosthecobacter fusiformis]
MKAFIPLLLCLWIIGVIRADDTAKIATLLAPAAQAGGIVTIPPGDYHLDGVVPITLSSNTTVSAYGARFHLPEKLGDKSRIILFQGTDLVHFTWLGGEFIGHVFDPAQKENAWEPSVNTKAIEITTTEGGATHDILFRDVKSNGVAGAVIGVHGLTQKGRDGQVITHAERVAVESCTLLRSGKFMWDYGYLWQILTWPDAYEAWEVERAKQYFRMDMVHDNLVMEDGDDRVRFDNRIKPLVVSLTDEPREVITFLTTDLPKNILHGRQYFIVGTNEKYIKISDQLGGPPLKFDGNAGPATSLCYNLSACYSAWAPTGAGPGKGAFDITGTKDVRVTGCQLSALGDTMHIQGCRNIVFANNQILGSRMGAFFLAEFCQNATITGNLIDGTNGSRVMSVEKSCTDVTITGNTFRNGGRGSWINQPKNFILQGNVFVNNTTKNEPDMRRGRIAFQTGKPVAFPELYFTLYEEGASYGPVIVKDNVFALGDSAPEDAVTFAPNGRDIQMTGNVFQNRTAHIVVDPSCENLIFRENQGAEVKNAPVGFNHGRR